MPCACCGEYRETSAGCPTCTVQTFCGCGTKLSCGCGMHRADHQCATIISFIGPAPTDPTIDLTGYKLVFA